MDNLERLKAMTKEDDDGSEAYIGILESCLESAKAAILARRYPYQEWPTKEVTVEIPPVIEEDPDTGETVIVTPGRTEVQQETILEPRYLDLQYRMAMDLYAKFGAEGEKSHTENGVTRNWDASWISKELLAEVIPYVGVVG